MKVVLCLCFKSKDDSAKLFASFLTGVGEKKSTLKKTSSKKFSETGIDTGNNLLHSLRIDTCDYLIIMKHNGVGFSHIYIYIFFPCIHHSLLQGMPYLLDIC